MAMDLTGIGNENEFYSHHYLGAILEGDLKDVLTGWRARAEETGEPAPFDGLRRLARGWFTLRNSLAKEHDPAERLVLQHDFLEELLSVLGYGAAGWRAERRIVEGAAALPIMAEVARPDGTPQLWLIEALDLSDEGEDPLTLKPHPAQFPQGGIGADEPPAELLTETLDDIITARIFARPLPPRWIVVASAFQIVLIDRSKWHQKRLMRFDLADIFNRRETSTLQVMAVLLHHDHICPAEGMALLETLDQNSHRHAFAVSEDLKYALREAVELLGNEAVWYLRHKAKDRILNRGLADQLTRECLRTMYRLLFLFYIEARPELGFAPMKSEAYRRGYSLESLRDRELARLTTPESLDGYYLHDSLARLFDLIYNGYPERGVRAQGDLEATPGFETFEIQPLKSHLFDPDRIPLLRTVRFRNHVLRRVLELMSLSREKPGKSRGRISYAQLGINQLGAVYEALLSYRGFFAEEDLYEVKKAGTDPDPLETAYFVPGPELEKYDDAEKVFERDGSLRCYSRGTFIYRLAGRDREKSASYYSYCVINSLPATRTLHL